MPSSLEVQKAKNPFWSQCLVCPFFAAVETWWLKMADSVKQDLQRFLLSGGGYDNIVMHIIFIYNISTYVIFCKSCPLLK